VYLLRRSSPHNTNILRVSPALAIDLCQVKEYLMTSWFELHGGDFQGQIKCLGSEAWPSFVREPEGNGLAERFIRTLKENLLWVRTSCAPSSSHSPGATMKLGSSRGMDTKRPHFARGFRATGRTDRRRVSRAT
jgi:hypothetical protein